MNQISFKKLLCRRDIQTTLNILSGMLSVKAGRGWINWLLKVGFTIRGGNTSAMARLAMVYMRILYAVYRAEGYRGVVIKTKAWYVLTMQAVGGMRIPAAQQLGCAVARASDGLPRVIPAESRRRIRQGDTGHLRLWVSWFSIYRVLQVPGVLKLTTITKPGKALSDSFLRESLTAITAFCKTLGYKEVGSAKSDLPPVQYISLTKSTPSVMEKGRKVSGDPRGILAGGVALLNSEVITSFRWLADMIDPKTSEGNFAGLRRKTIGELLDGIAKAALPEAQFPIGKLGFKLEAAGKVRVFAMVECWTQWLLFPLHSFIFKLLGRMPTDGTMDQLAPINRLRDLGHTKFWCYDLSAATDRLPVALQANILNYLFGSSFGWAWANLLVGRDYLVPSIPSGVVAKDIPRSVRYAVGQPMGALSSWAMLALTHHFIVGWAAYRVGWNWGTFTDYAVLGDDIVIANGKVAAAYLQLMDTLGVEIGLAKSLISRRGVLEFAKRFWRRDADCSPVPFKEMVAALHAFEQSTEFIRKYELGARSIAGFVGWGYKVRGRLAGDFDKLPRRLATIGKWRCSPWGTLGHNVSSWLNIKSFVIRPEWLVQVTEMWPALPEQASKAFVAWASKDEQRLKSLREALPSRGTYSGSPGMTDWVENELYHICTGKGNLVSTRLLRFPGELYNVLYEIQVMQWEVANPLIKADFNKVQDILFKMRTSRIPLDEWKFLEWVSSFKLRGQLRPFRVIGERVELRATPSILLATRLYDFCHRWGNQEEIKAKV